MNKTKLEHYEHKYGPHFTEECAMKAVKHMENEDGTKGPRWSVEEAERVAMQFGVNLKSGKFNKYDWFVALNMIRSDFYRAVINMTGSDNVKHFVELAKAWLNDKDIEEGKMWFYFKYVMCEEGREDDDEEDDEYEGHYARRHGRMSMNTYHKRHHDYYDDDEDDDEYDYPHMYTHRGYDHDGMYARRGRRISRY